MALMWTIAVQSAVDQRLLLRCRSRDSAGPNFGSVSCVCLQRRVLVRVPALRCGRVQPDNSRVDATFTSYQGFSGAHDHAAPFRRRILGASSAPDVLQVSGHFAAQLDPLNLWERPHPAVLQPQTYGFSESDLDRECASRPTYLGAACDTAGHVAITGAMQVLRGVLEHDRLPT